MDAAALMTEWILPVGVLVGALTIAGLRWGIIALGLAGLVIDAASDDRMLLETAWAADRVVEDPTTTILGVLAAIAMLEIVLDAAIPSAGRLLAALRVVGAGVVGAVFVGTDTITLVAGAAAGVALGALSAVISLSMVRGAVASGGHPAILSLFMTGTALVLAALAILVPLGGYLVLALAIRAGLRLRRTGSEKHMGLRILA